MVKALLKWSLVLATACGSANQPLVAEPLPLVEIAADLQGSLRYGAGRTNGQTFPISVLTFSGSAIDFYQQLATRFAGRYTVTIDQTSTGPIVSVADIYSDQCPGCQRADLDPAVNLRQAMFFHLMPAGPKTMAMGMPGIAHVAAQMPAGSYTSVALGNLSSHMHLRVQNLYRFEDSEVQTGGGELVVSPDQFLDDMGNRLRSAGYKPLSAADAITTDRPRLPPQQSFERTLTWHNQEGVVALRISRLSTNPQTQVEIYETRNP